MTLVKTHGTHRIPSITEGELSGGIVKLPSFTDNETSRPTVQMPPLPDHGTPRVFIDDVFDTDVDNDEPSAAGSHRERSSTLVGVVPNPVPPRAPT